jgi:predicted metal-binding membrane protein
VITPLERLLRRDRWIVGAGLLVVAGLAWWWLLRGAGMGMTAVEMTRHSLMNMPATGPATWDRAYTLMMFSMWWIMMVAMMLPSATPVVLLAAALNRRSRAPEPPFGPTPAFVAGYLLAWGAFSVVAIALQWGFDRVGWINSMGVSVQPVLSGVLLLAAGAWQFTPWKQACLNHCRSPVDFLVAHQGSGVGAALRTGMLHGAWCLGCCWFLMLLLFVGGVMNLYWIIGLAVYVWLEKVTPIGARLSRWLGVGLMLWGGALLLGIATSH